MPTDYKKIYAIKKKNEEIIRAQLKTTAPDTASGIYCFYRTDESGIKHAYIGQATSGIIKRMAEHLSGYQYIDLSLKKHGFFSEDNPYGYRASIIEYCAAAKCDEREQFAIKQWADAGYQLKNRTSGSQGSGKAAIAEQRAPRGYYDGKKQGWEDARKFIASLFSKNLVAVLNGKPNKNKEKALAKFTAFLQGDGEENG